LGKGFHQPTKCLVTKAKKGHPDEVAVLGYEDKAARFPRADARRYG